MLLRQHLHFLTFTHSFFHSFFLSFFLFFSFSFSIFFFFFFLCFLSSFHFSLFHSFSFSLLGADSDGDSNFHTTRGFNFNRGLPHFRGHSGPNFNTPLGYGRGDMNAAWEVMSDEGSGTGTFRDGTYAQLKYITMTSVLHNPTHLILPLTL